MGIILIAMRPKEVSPEKVERLKAMAPDYEVVVTHEHSVIQRRIDEVEVLFGEFGRRYIHSTPNLKWYQQSGAGADWLLKTPELDTGKFTITTASGVHGVQITEHILAFLLAFARGFKQTILGQRDRVWQQNREQPLFELEGKRCLLIGVGAIGRRFAKVGSAFGMEIVGVRRKPAAEPIEGAVRVVSTAQMDTELPETDFVIITAPLTDETRHMFDRRRFDLLKKGAYLVNIGRGGIINEEDMIRALRDGRLAGAGLDVFETEPLPKDSPLWEMENVIVTPHYAGMTPRYEDRLWEIFLDNLERFLAGEPMRNVVDRKLGY